jgi:hypothetical protein
MVMARRLFVGVLVVGLVVAGVAGYVLFTNP